MRYRYRKPREASFSLNRLFKVHCVKCSTNYTVDLDDLHQALKKQITEAQWSYQGPADSRRSTAPTFDTGSFAFVKSEHIHMTRPLKKLDDKYYGPFEVIAHVGPLSYTLRLPDSMRTIHPVFHVSMLEPSIPE